jgi:redox-sensitive bicupin YhaK (pirin superfamily)
VNVYVSEPQAGFVQSFNLREGRQIYFICIQGHINVNGKRLAARDAARITSATSGRLDMEAGPDGSHM